MYTKTILFICLLGSFNLMLALAASIQSDPGAWLAGQLGLNDEQAAGEAISKASRAAQNFVSKPLDQQAGQVDSQLMERYNELSKNIRDSAVQLDDSLLVQTKDLVDKLEISSQDGKNPRATSMLAYSRWLYTAALLRASLPIDAAIEAQMFKKTCNENAGVCSSLGSGLDQLISNIDARLASMGPAGLLGLQTTTRAINQQNIKQEAKLALKKYRLRLHPDKNAHLDAESKQRLTDLFNKVQEAYKMLQ